MALSMGMRTSFSFRIHPCIMAQVFLFSLVNLRQVRSEGLLQSWFRRLLCKLAACRRCRRRDGSRARADMLGESDQRDA